MGCEVMAVEPHLETTPLVLLEHNISLRPLQTALWHADVVCVLVKHQALIDEVDMIQSHTAVVDAVGILN
jgi:UDP-N-acetyl-D-mannosaminuronic acid dehydrogenase